MREKFARFMQGRNGMDELGRAESILLWIDLIISLFVRKIPIAYYILLVLFWVILFHMYFRVFSRNLSKRYQENQKFLNFRYNMTVKAGKAKKRRSQMKNYRFYKCPMCQQEVRVPKGHGKIEITCPKCREKFIRRS